MRWILGMMLMMTASAAQAQLMPKLSDFRVNGVELSADQDSYRVALPPKYWQDAAREVLKDRDYMAWLPIDFHDGVIEAEVKGEIAPNAPDFARGFVGFSFRIADGRFEKIYLRPANGVVDDMVRRNHSVQYAAFPDFLFSRLRAESPERYETAADIAPGRWVHVRIDVQGQTARLFLDHRPNPVLVVKDLKLGAGQHGGVGLWVETGTIAHYRNLRITQK
jgi:hypothetical protein